MLVCLFVVWAIGWLGAPATPNAEPDVTTGGSGECGQWEKSARVYASKVQKGGEPSNTGARSGGRERAEGMIDTAHIWGVEVWR